MDYITELNLNEYIHEVSRRRKYNKYILGEKRCVGFLASGKQFYFDKEYYEIIKDFWWREDDYGYVCTYIYHRGKHKKVLMHRLILNPQHGIEVDHINGNKTDNRKENLRNATRFQNNINKGLLPKNKTGVPGVSWLKRNKKWMANINFEGKRIYLGIYSDFNEAVSVRHEAEERYFGEYSYLNSQKQSERQYGGYNND